MIALNVWEKHVKSNDFQNVFKFFNDFAKQLRKHTKNNEKQQISITSLGVSMISLNNQQTYVKNNDFDRNLMKSNKV